MPGVDVLILYVLLPLTVLAVVYRLGHRIGKAEGRLQGRDETAARQDHPR